MQFYVRTESFLLEILLSLKACNNIILLFEDLDSGIFSNCSGCLQSFPKLRSEIRKLRDIPHGKLTAYSPLFVKSGNLTSCLHKHRVSSTLFFIFSFSKLAALPLTPPLFLSASPSRLSLSISLKPDAFCRPFL